MTPILLHIFLLDFEIKKSHCQNQWENHPSRGFGNEFFCCCLQILKNDTHTITYLRVGFWNQKNSLPIFSERTSQVKKSCQAPKFSFYTVLLSSCSLNNAFVWHHYARTVNRHVLVFFWIGPWWSFRKITGGYIRQVVGNLVLWARQVKKSYRLHELFFRCSLTKCYRQGC